MASFTQGRNMFKMLKEWALDHNPEGSYLICNSNILLTEIAYIYVFQNVN